MELTDGLVVTIELTLWDQDGEVIESAEGAGAMTFRLGGDRILPGIAAVLTGMKVGETREGVIPPGELVPQSAAPRRRVLLTEFPEGTDTTVGARFQAKAPNGQPVQFEIIERSDDAVVACMLHPLHDHEVKYMVKAIAARRPDVPPPPPIDAPDLTDDLDLEFIEGENEPLPED